MPARAPKVFGIGLPHSSGSQLAALFKANGYLWRHHQNGKLAQSNQLSDASTREQAGLGLDHLPPEDFASLSDLNQRYRQKFGFPFIVCVRLVPGIPGLLENFETRLAQQPESERQTAIDQVHAIARLRLSDLISG